MRAKCILKSKNNLKDLQGFSGIVEERRDGYYFKPDKKSINHWFKVEKTAWDEEFANGKYRG